MTARPLEFLAPELEDLDTLCLMRRRPVFDHVVSDPNTDRHDQGIVDPNPSALSRSRASQARPRSSGASSGIDRAKHADTHRPFASVGTAPP